LSIKVKTTGIVLSINSKKGQRLGFHERYFVCGKERVGYQDVDGVSIHLERMTRYATIVPLGSTADYYAAIQAKGKTYEVDADALSFLAGKGKSEQRLDDWFTKFYALMETKTKPSVITNLLLKLAAGEKYRLDDSVTITLEGLYRNRTPRKPEFLPWGQYYNSEIKEGKLYIWAKGPDSFNKFVGINVEPYRQYFSCSLVAMNAVVVPDLLKYLVRRKGVIDEKTRAELMEKKNEAAREMKLQSGSSRRTTSPQAP